MINVSLVLIESKQGASTLFLLFSEQWFIQIWNDTDNENPRFKEELSLSLLEASLLSRKYISCDTVSKKDSWLYSSIEVVEICAKVLDWKLLTQQQSPLSEQVSQAYLIYIEEVT